MKYKDRLNEPAYPFTSSPRLKNLRLNLHDYVLSLINYVTLYKFPFYRFDDR